LKILHLSDLHFGYDENDTMKTQRENLLNGLLYTIKSKIINIVIITGDIVWQCKEDGYIEAEKWLKKLSNEMSVPFDHFIICAGNHEVDHNETKEISYYTNPKEVNKILTYENIKFLERRFKRFIKFCEKLGVAKPKINNKDNFLIGSIDFEEVKFWIINTAWYAKEGGHRDKNKLWIGTNFYDYLFNEKSKNPKHITVCINHHPKEWLNEHETQSNNLNKSLFEMISEQCEINFTGHTHCNIQKPHRAHSHMLCYSAGASFKDSDYIHNFSIFSLDSQKSVITRCVFISKDRTNWVHSGEDSEILSKQSSTNIMNTGKCKKGVTKNSNIKKYISKIGINMLNIIESDFSSDKVMIWPVTPRRVLNSIHLAQLKLMSLLYNKFGWSVQAIISNCGANLLPQDITKGFVDKIKKYHNKAGIKNFKCEYLDRYFMRNHKLASKVLESFTKIGSRVSILDLKKIKEKRYDDAKKEETQKLSVLDYILPILQYAVVEALTHEIKNKSTKKSIVIAGNDEETQWSRAVSFIGEDFVGALLIPELNNSSGKNINQDNQNQVLKTMIDCCSKEQLKDNFNIGNFASWFYKMFVILPSYELIDNINVYSVKPPIDMITLEDGKYENLSEIKKNEIVDKIWDEIEKSKISE